MFLILMVKKKWEDEGLQKSDGYWVGFAIFKEWCIEKEWSIENGI